LTDEATRVLLIRHATNDYVSSKRLAGRTPGVHLNDRGLAEAEAVAARLQSTPLAAVYTSPLERAIETAGPIAEKHDLHCQIMDGLMETDCGEWAGGAIDELSQTELWRRIQVEPSSARFPGGESIFEVQQRMVGAVAELRSLHSGKTIAVVSHSDPIKLLMAYHVGMHMDMFQRLTVDPASISELEFGTQRTRLLRSNDCTHLSPLEGEGK
jgi:probable phosphomutase (TIGR03848 family)